MHMINALDFGIRDGADITEKLCAILKQACAEGGEKNIVFEKGTYYISAEK